MEQQQQQQQQQQSGQENKEEEEDEEEKEKREVELSDDQQQGSLSEHDLAPKGKKRGGKLPDYGINPELYCNYPDGTKVNSFIKTGTDFALLPRNPLFLQRDDPYEPLYVPKPDVLETALKREIEKFCFADTLINKVVYDCSDPSPYHKDNMQAEMGLDALPYYIPTGPTDTTLVFESRFESGNLRRAIQISEFEYNLILKPDYFTNGNTQWYYFSVANTQNYQEYRFNIINMMKPDSLYNQGMKPQVYSETLARKKNVGWYRDGYDICYYQNNMKRKTGGYYYSLVFSVKFPFKNDTVYLTHSYPYTYSQLLKFLSNLENNDYKKSKMKKKVLCQTMAGNDCHYLVITDYNEQGQKLNKENKKSIMITSRVHPGETMASYIVEYMIDYLTGPSQEAQQLRKQFIFKVVPMLNIDGVLNGNYRVGLCGLDLNRQWLYPNKAQHPTIFYTKQMVKKLTEQKGLVFFCDIHGHSRKKNIFMYGCSGKDPAKKELAFPILMKNNCQVFCYKDCCFAVQKDREGSARIALWKDFNLNNCYTLEVSFCGADFGKYEFFHYNQDIFQEIAENFCLSLVECYEPDQMKVKAALEEAKQIANGNDNTNNNKMADNSDGDSDYDNINEDDKSGQNKQEVNVNQALNTKEDTKPVVAKDKKLQTSKNINQKKKK